MTNMSSTTQVNIQSCAHLATGSPLNEKNTSAQYIAKTRTESEASTKNFQPPHYLQPTEYCNITTPIALILSALTMVILFYITINWSTLLFHTPVNHQLNLFVETAFVILCTIATWKHSKK